MESGVRVKELRVLLRSFDRLETIQFPSDEFSKIGLKRELVTVTESLCDLQRQGIVETLAINYYSFDSAYHFSVVNNRLLHFGLFQPVHSVSGVQVLTSFVVKNNTAEGIKLVDDLRFLMSR